MNVEFLSGILKGAKYLATQQVVNLSMSSWRARFIEVFREADFDLSLNSTRLVHVVEKSLIRNASNVDSMTVSTVVVMVSAVLNQRFTQAEYDMMYMLVKEGLGLTATTSLATLSRIN